MPPTGLGEQIKIEKKPRAQPLCEVLPSELIAEIFELTSNPPPFRKTPDTNFTSPLLLGAVCRRWRAIAWGLPTLWKYVHLVLSIKHYDTRVDLLEEWLNRARDCPLHIVFRVPMNLQEEFMEWCDDGPYEVFDLFAKKRVQWEKLDLDLIAQECIASLEEGKGGLPLLQAVALNDYADEDLDVDLLKDSPALRRLSLKGGSHHLRFCHPPSCAALTDLYLSSLSMDDTVSLLRETVNIKSCYLKFIDSEQYFAFYDSDEENRLLSFPFLETLVINACSSNHMLRLLGKVPKLRDLSMKGTGYPDLPVLDRFFKEHDCKLDTFHLTTDASMEIDKIRKVLSHHSKTLTSLSIYHEQYDTDAVLHVALHKQLLMPIVSHGKPTFLPNLHHYEYLPPEWPKAPMECVVRTLQARWRLFRAATQTAQPKNDFSVRLPASVRLEVEQLLAKEMAEGLRINFDLVCPRWL